MKRWAILGALLAATPALAQGTDETSIRAIEAQQETSWNAHDIAAWVQPYAPDSQFVTAFGLWWKSRDEIQRKMGWAFTNLFAQSRIHADQIEVTSVTPDVATAHIAWTLDGAKGPDGSDVGTVHRAPHAEPDAAQGRRPVADRVGSGYGGDLSVADGGPAGRRRGTRCAGQAEALLPRPRQRRLPHR